MKREILRLIVTILLANFLATACYTRTVYRPVVAAAPAGEMIVTEAPPPVRHERIGIAPSAAHVWVPGFWIHRAHRWVWVPGHWEVRPRSGAMWVAGHWDRTPSGWVWSPGHWE